MSRKVLIVAIVVAVMLVALVAPAAAVPLEAADTVSMPTVVRSEFSSGSPVPVVFLGRVAPPLPIHTNGGGGCSGAGSCPS